MPIRFSIQLDPEQPVGVTPGGALAISPDGRHLVFAGGPPDRHRLFLRRFDSAEVVELAGTDGAMDPCFSPDGRWVAFRVQMEIRRVPSGGGGPEVLVPDGVDATGMAWDEHGIVYSRSSPSGLYRWTGKVAPAQQVWQNPSPDVYHAHPEPLPGGHVILVTRIVQGAAGWRSSVESIDVRTGEHRLLVSDACNPRFMPPARLLFWQAGALVAAPFDPRGAVLTDVPEVIARPLASGELYRPPRFAVSRAGVLATLPGDRRYDLTQLAWRDASGQWSDVAKGAMNIDAPRRSPGGGRVAVLMGQMGGDLWVVDLQRSTRIRLTTGDHYHHPVWTPDGQRIVFTSSPREGRASLEWIVADGSSPPQSLWAPTDRTWVYPTDFLPDGRLLVTVQRNGAGHADICTFDPARRADPVPMLPVAAHRYGARVSPDGRFIAYTSEETGTMEVYLHRFPSLEPKVRVSPSGGYRPVWSGDGRLYFRYLDRVMVADVAASPTGEVNVSPARLVAEHMPDARYDVSADGQRLLMGRPAGDLSPQRRIDVTIGWSAHGSGVPARVDD